MDDAGIVPVQPTREALHSLRDREAMAVWMLHAQTKAAGVFFSAEGSSAADETLCHAGRRRHRVS